MMEWIKKTRLNLCCLQQTYFKGKNTQAEGERMENYNHAPHSQNKVIEEQYLQQTKQTLSKKVNNMQRRTLHNNQRMNLPGKYNYKYIQT